MLQLALFVVGRGNTGEAECTDHNRECPGWARTGECDANAAYMHVACRMSCGICPKQRSSDAGSSAGGRTVKQLSSSSAPEWLLRPLQQPLLELAFMTSLEPENRSVVYRSGDASSSSSGGGGGGSSSSSNVTLASLLEAFTSRWQAPFVSTTPQQSAPAKSVADCLDFLAQPGASITLRVEHLGGAAARRVLGSLLPPGVDLFGGPETRMMSAGAGATSAHVYISSAGGSAAQPHSDGGQVLVQQLMGSKLWRFAPHSEDAEKEAEPASSAGPRARAATPERALLRTGDALWMAPRTRHVARTPRGAREPSVHMTWERCKLQHPWCSSCSAGTCGPRRD